MCNIFDLGGNMQDDRVAAKIRCLVKSSAWEHESHIASKYIVDILISPKGCVIMKSVHSLVCVVLGEVLYYI